MYLWLVTLTSHYFNELMVVVTPQVPHLFLYFLKRYRDGQVPSLLNLVLVSNHKSFLNIAPLPSVVDVIISP